MLKNILFVTLLSAAAVCAQDLSGVLATEEQTAKTLVAGKNWQKLEILARDWVERDKANWESWYYLGLSRFRLKKTDEAINALTTAEKLSDGRNNETLLLLLAEGQIKKEDWAAAEKSYRRVLQEQNIPELWNKLLTVVAKQEGVTKRVQEVAILKKLLGFAAYVNDIDYWRRYAALLLPLKQITTVRDAYQHVLRLQPDDLALAEWVYRYDLEHDDAARLAKSEEHLIKLDEENPLVLIGYARQALAEKHVRRARDYFLVISKNDKYPQEQAQAFVGLGKLTTVNRESLHNYLSAIRINPAYIPAWEGAVVALRSANEHKEAERYFLRMRVIERRVRAGRSITPALLEGF